MISYDQSWYPQTYGIYVHATHVYKYSLMGCLVMHV